MARVLITCPPIMGLTANELTRQIIAYLEWRRCLVWRNNTGKVRTSRGRFITFGRVGSGDIIGMMRGGQFLSIEVKVGDDVESPDQIAFRNLVNTFGGMAIVARSLEDVQKVL